MARAIAPLLVASVLIVMALVIGTIAGTARADQPTPPATQRADLAIYQKAFAAAKANEWSKAHALAAEAHDPLGAKILRWWEYQRYGNAAAFEDIARFIDDNPDWPGQRRLQIGAESAMRTGVSDAEVIAWFRWRDPISRDGLLRFADALLTLGEREQAARFARQAWVEGDFGRIELKETYKRFESLLRKEDHIARLDRLTWENQDRSARRMFAYVDKGHRSLAEARLALRAFAGGVDAAIRRVPKELRDDPGLLYERVRWRRRKGRDADARDLLHNAPQELAQPKFWWRERSLQIRRALEEGSVSEAYRLASGHHQITSAEFAEAEWLSGWISLRFLNEPGKAYGHFVRLHNAVLLPISRGRAAYWAGRAAEAQGDIEGAMLWYGEGATLPGTFYGQLCAARVAAADAPLVRAPDNADGAGDLTLEGHELVAAARLAAFFEVEELLKPLILRLAELAHTRADHAFVGELALSLRRPDYAIHAAKRATRDGYVSIERLFPVVDLPFALPDDRLEHALVLSLTRQESLFDTRARSRAGARGLMQLMPATAKLVARQMRVNYARANLTSNPAYNMTLGSEYLAGMIERYDGSYLLAVAAYNGGPGNVARWLDAMGDPRYDADIDVIDWIEMIPLSETRNYVQRVLEGLQIYRWHRGQPPTVASLEHDLLRGTPPGVRAIRCAAGGGGEAADTLRATC